MLHLQLNSVAKTDQYDRTKVSSNKSSFLQTIILQKTHNHYNYLQSQLKQILFTKVIKIPSLMAWVKRPISLIKKGRKR